MFARVKFGIGRPKPGVEVYDHVLTKFGDDEATELESKGTWAKACDAVRGVLVDGLAKAMSAVYTEHKAPKQPKESKESPAAAANEGDAPAVTVDTNVRDGAEKVEMDSTPL